MFKPFDFWQTVSRKAQWQPWGEGQGLQADPFQTTTQLETFRLMDLSSQSN